MMKKDRFFGLLTCVLMITSITYSQFSLSTDIKSRYVWRGMDFGASPSIQPSLTYKYNVLSIGIWGAYAFPPNGYAENDYWITLDVPSSTGTYSLIITDYTFPSSGIRLGNINDGGGAHTIEIGAGYLGIESFPIALRGYVNVYNDPDQSAYIECSYPFTLSSTTISVTVGAAINKSAAYGTNGFSVINISLSTTRSIEISEKFTLPMSITYVLNPAWEQASIVVGVTL
ncbi:MAG: hypothetical protein N3A63_03000 [Bacteroidetes bacterium]|nr:hypothetical protein [Bacteroidota bacterium]